MISYHVLVLQASENTILLVTTFKLFAVDTPLGFISSYLTKKASILICCKFKFSEIIFQYNSFLLLLSQVIYLMYLKLLFWEDNYRSQ